MSKDAAIILFTGFTQQWGPGSGLWRLYDRLAEVYHDRRRYLLALRTWDSSPEATATLVRHADPKHLAVVGFSYGCGWALPQFADSLGGNRIDTAFLIDPVPRYSWPLKWMSLTRWGTYDLPASVRQAYLYRQVNGTPYGRPVEASDGSDVQTRMVFGTGSNLREHARGFNAHWQNASLEHAGIDDSDAVHDDVMGLLDQRLAGSPKVNA